MGLQSYNTINYLPILRSLAGLHTQQQAADYFEIHRRTWIRWETSGKIKRHVRELLKIKAGYMPYRDWYQFRISDGLLWTPHNHSLSPQVIESLPLLLQCARGTYGYDKFIEIREKELS